jgi:predicted permease
MTQLGQDLRSAFRIMKHAPGFTAAAAATLALGLGLNGAVLSFAYTLFLKPLPFDDAGRLVIIDQTREDRPLLSGFGFSYPDYAHYRDNAKSFAKLTAHYSTSPLQIATKDTGFGVSGAVVTASYFDALRLKPALGRFFTEDEDKVPGRDAVAVIGHELWRTKFGADPRILGTSVRINGTTFSVIGVAPEGFGGIVMGLTPNEVWIPTAMFRVGYRYCDAFTRACAVVGLLGRLEPRATIQDAQSELTLLARQLESEFPQTNKGRGVLVRPATGVRIQEQARIAPMVRLLAGAAALVLLVASANVAGLLLARGLKRRKEIAIRMALGAGRGRIVRQLVVESIALSTLGAVAGLVVAVWSTDLARQFFARGSAGEALNLDLSILDLRLFAAGLAIALLTGLVTGVAPALQATRRDTLPALKEEAASTASPRRTLLREGLIVVQLAVSVLLLVGSGLLVRSSAMLHRGPGFDPDSVVLTRLRPSLVGYSSERSWEYQREVIRRLEALPGVAAASTGNVPPLPGWARPNLPVQLLGDTSGPAQAFRASTTNVGPHYFKTLGGSLKEGREFDARDRQTSPRVTVLNQALANRFWPNGGATGNTVRIGGRPAEVIGVVDDVQYLSVLDRPEEIAYLAYWQQDSADNLAKDSQTIIKVSAAAAALLPQIRRAIASVDPAVPASEPQTLGARLDYHFASVRGARMLLVSFGALALVVSAIGLYAALAFAVGQRTREIAIRMALGADRSHVSRLLMHRGGALVLLGVGLGLAAAVVSGPLLAHLLYGVTPRDPSALLVGPSVLSGVAVLATWLPARRATSIDAMSALRRE